MKNYKMVVKLVAVFVITCATGFAAATGSTKDSEVNTIFVPYQANSAYYPYPLVRSRQVRKVMVPVEIDMQPSLHLDARTKTAQARLVNFLDGAYPVYYTSGRANGHFNGEISILE